MSVSRQSIESRAELLKLARLLGRAPDELAYLEAVSVVELRELREQVTETLFDSHLGALNRLASASRLLPVGVVAQMGEKVFGPLLSARITGLLDPDRAVDVGSRLPDSFLADVAVELDPRRASAVLARIPADRIAAITRELLARGEFVTMGRFVGHLPDESLQAAVDVSSPDDLLQVALVLENKDRLGDLLEMVGTERVDQILEAADRAELGPEARELLEQAAGGP
jgi:hypothetical protein